MLGYWINKYNRSVELKDYNLKRETDIMKLRKTTFDERLEIVRWTIESEMNYKEYLNILMLIMRL